jgi:hypothetical protein
MPARSEKAKLLRVSVGNTAGQAIISAQNEEVTGSDGKIAYIPKGVGVLNVSNRRIVATATLDGKQLFSKELPNTQSTVYMLPNKGSLYPGQKVLVDIKPVDVSSLLPSLSQTQTHLFPLNQLKLSRFLKLC